jgi:preprotein translocase subunit SecD
MLKQLLMVITLSFITFFACSEPETITLEFRIAEDEPAQGLTEMVFSLTGENFYLHNEILVDQSNVDSAMVTTHNGRPAVELLLTSEGTTKFQMLTGSNIGKRCGMVLNGQLVSAPIIRDTIKVGRAIIVGDFTEAETLLIAQGLNQP